MIELHVAGESIEEIRAALSDLYAAKQAAPVAPVEPAPAPVAPVAPTPAPVEPETAAPAPVEPETAAPAPVAPVAPAPTYTLAQVAKAGADFVTAHPERMPELQAKLLAYGASSVAELSEDQLGAFATELRGMGGAI